MCQSTNFYRSIWWKIVVGYEALISSEDIDAVYLPLPPALHFHWAQKALETGKHVF